jgi:starch-binding outer membrane protein, SusD/RagB family
MIMKKIILLTITIVFIGVSCQDDVFDRVPLNSISDADVWGNPVMLRAYVSDLYVRMPYNAAATSVFKWHHSEAPSYPDLDLQTDIGTLMNGNMGALTAGNMSQGNDAANGWWDWAIIRDINIFIERIGDADIDEIVKNQLEGEARVLRAMAYFEKQKRYGGVPLVDVPLDPFNPIDQKYTLRATEEAISDFIDADLTAAIPLLTSNSHPLGRINKWTAYAQKARANLWSASIAKYGTVQLNGLVGIPAGRANELYGKASEAANQVILSGNYELFNQYPNDKSENYRKLFITPNNGEAIFSNLFDGVNFFHTWNFTNLPQSIAGGYGSRSNPTLEYVLALENIDGSPDQPLFGPDHLYDNAYQIFEGKDPRLLATSFFDNEVWAGYPIRTYEGIDPTPGVANPDAILTEYGAYYQGMPQVAEDSRLMPVYSKSTNTGFLMKKYCSDEALKRFVDTDFMEFRLAEMYLIRAEAEFELGNLATAATALNATRARAGISLVDEGTITLNHVRTERMSELAFEGFRWWDLRRWRNAEEVLDRLQVYGVRIIYHFDTGKYYYLPVRAETFDRGFYVQHYYNPITVGRINQNLDLVENPGY